MASNNLTLQSETARINFVEFAGDTLKMAFAYKEGSETGNMIDLNGYNVEMEVRKMDKDGVSLEPSLLSYSKDNGGITTGDSDANIMITLESSDTLLLGVGEFGYFIKVTHLSSGFVNTLIRGKLILKAR